jgi:hypothetical protein
MAWAICFAMGSASSDGDRPAGDALREIVAVDELHHQRPDTAGFLEAVKVRDSGMVQRGEGLRFAHEPGASFRVVG